MYVCMWVWVYVCGCVWVYVCYTHAIVFSIIILLFPYLVVSVLKYSGIYIQIEFLYNTENTCAYMNGSLVMYILLMNRSNDKSHIYSRCLQ